MSTLLQKRGDALVDYANRLRVPPQSSPVEICDWLTDQCIIVYLQSESTNSLQLLHAVTSSWALGLVVQVRINCQMEQEFNREVFFSTFNSTYSQQCLRTLFYLKVKLFWNTQMLSQSQCHT
jgi:hypothetical protein